MDMDQSGGFFNDGGPSGGGAFGDRGDDGGQQQRAKNAVHCSIAQILNGITHDNGLVLFRQKVNVAIVVGLVRTVNDTTVKVNYWIEDHTGCQIEVQMLKMPDEPEAAPQSIMERTYVRVYGQVKFNSAGSFEPTKPHILGFKVVPLTNISEVITHQLKTYRDAMVLERISQRLNAQRGDTGASSFLGSTNPFGDEVPAGGGAGAGGFVAGGGATRGLSAIQTAVLKAISNVSTSEGIHFAQLKDHMRSVPEKQLREICEFLVQEGHAYNTIDDSHFKSTES